MKLKKTILTLIVLILISGCTNDKKNTSEIKILDKAPDSLSEIHKEIGKILDNIGKIEKIDLDLEVVLNEGKEGQESQKGGADQSSTESSHSQSQSSEEAGGESSGEGSGSGSESHQSGGNSSEDDETNKEEKNKKVWMEIDKSIEAIHLKWSSYENEGAKKGGSRDSIVELKDTINKFTKFIEERDIISIYDFGSQSLLNLKPFYDLYKDDYRGEICQLKYSTYQYYIKAITGDKEAAREEFKSKENSINRIRMLIGENDKKSKELDKIITSIDSIGISLDEASRRVFILEKDTLIKNLKSLE